MIDNPLPELIKDFGSEAKLAVAMGISQAAVSKAKGLRLVSPKMAIRIETVTNGRLKRWQMRPDMWEPPEGALAPEPAPEKPLAPTEVAA